MSTESDSKRRWTGAGRGEPRKKQARGGGTGSGTAPKAFKTATPAVRNAYTGMFEGFRDQMDAHHDRRERVVKASRDITALSKKVIFALQRVRRIHPALPRDVDGEVQARLDEISRLLAAVAPEMQGINRGRYGKVLFGMEELMEALTFLHYLTHQTLLSPEEGEAQVEALCRRGASESESKESNESKVDESKELEAEPTADTPVIAPDYNDYIMGVFDLSGEMMRFATTSAALRGELAAADADADADADAKARTIVGDMQELDSFFQMLPRRFDKSWKTKMSVMQTSVKKVERLGYDLCVRGSEMPKGWVPDAPEVDAPTP